MSEEFENEELPDDEEEILVYVEFPNCVESNMFSNERLKLDIIGIDTENPVMQINGKFYEGTYEDAVGTYMFFEKDNNVTVDDTLFQIAPTLKYKTKSRKLLKMQRVFVAPRTEVLGESVHSECNPNMNTIVEAGVPPKYQEEALSFWENARTERIEAVNTYLEKQRIRREKRLQGISPVSDSDEDNPFMLRAGQFEGDKGDQQLGADDGNFLDGFTGLNEFERFLRNSAEEPLEDDQETENTDSQIEPEPSTSRETKPFIGKNIPKNKGTVKVVKSIRRRNNPKLQKSIKKRNVTKRLETDLLGDLSSVEESEDSSMYENFESVNDSEADESEFITDEIQVDQKPRYLLKQEYSMDKKTQRKGKGEAKLKEVAEQLKRMSAIAQEEVENEDEDEEVVNEEEAVEEEEELII